MDPNYAPPDSPIADRQSETLTVHLRAIWVMGVIGIFGIVVILIAFIRFRIPITLEGIAGFLALSVLESWVPVRIALQGKTVTPPWWADVLAYGAGVVGLACAYGGKVPLAFLIYASILVANLCGAIALFIAERKKGLRAYIKGRRYVFKNEESGEIV